MKHRLFTLFLVLLIVFNGIAVYAPTTVETKVYANGEEFALQWNKSNGPAIQKALETGDGIEGALAGSRLLAKGGFYGNGNPVAFTTFHALECQYPGGKDTSYKGGLSTGDANQANWCVDTYKPNHREVQFVGPAYYCVKQDNNSWKKQQSKPGAVNKGGSSLTPENYGITPSVIVVLNKNDFGSTNTYGYYAQITHVSHESQSGRDSKGNFISSSTWQAPDYDGGGSSEKNRGMDDWNGHEDNQPPDSCIIAPFHKTIKSGDFFDNNPDIPLMTSPPVYNLQSPKYANDKAFLKKWGLDPETLNSTATGGNDQGSISAPGLKCDFGFNPLTWVVCPVINGMVSLANAMDNIIVSQMTVGSVDNAGNPSQIFCDGSSAALEKSKKTCTAYKTAWYSFRNIALGLLAIVGLIIIISQMADLEIFNAYTVKKILPRLIFAAIAITLSWQLMQFFVTLTNDLGLGIRNLIYKPFQEIIQSGNKINNTGLAAANLIGGGGILALGVFGVLSFALTAALAVLVAFITLVLRQLLIIVMIIIAPVAIVASVLPNTQRVYKLWWENFSKALLMFPLIAAMIATGHVFAAVSLYGDGGTSALATFVAFAAYFGPYFLLPATFKFAGGALSAVSGAVNRAAAPGMQGLSGFRSNRFKQRRANGAERAREGRIFKSAPVGSKRHRANQAIQYGAHAGKMGYSPKNWKQNIKNAAATTNADKLGEQMEKNSSFRQISNNEDYMQALRHGKGTDADAMQYLRGKGYNEEHSMRAVSAIRQARKEMGASNLTKASIVAEAATSKGFEGGPGEMYRAINRAAEGDEMAVSSLIGQASSSAQKAGRGDLSEGSFGAKLTQAGAIDAALRNGGAAAETAAVAAANVAMADEVVNTTTPSQVANMKPGAVKNLAPAYARRMDSAAIAKQTADAALLAAQTTGAPPAVIALAQANADEANKKYVRAVAKTAGMLDAVGSANPENGETLADELMSQTLTASGSTVQQEIEAYRTDSQFLEMRREYSSGGAAAAGGAGGGGAGGGGAGN